jgi:hypothetical protein
MDVVSVSVAGLIFAAIFIVILFGVTMGVVSYGVSHGVSRANQEFYSKREDASNLKILQLEAKVSWLERRLDEMTQQLMRRYDDPKGDAVAP